MLNWPPSPSVEDEATALAHEHLLDVSIQSLKSEDQPAPSRGSVDQYPIIIDSDIQRQPAEPEHQRPRQKPDLSVPETCSSDDSTGPRTPPSTSRKDDTKDVEVRATSDRGHVSSSSVSNSSNSFQKPNSTSSRPREMHVLTDLDGEYHIPTSRYSEGLPYSYSRMSASQRYNPNKKVTDELYLSPSRTAASPISIHQNYQEKAPPISSRTSNAMEISVPEANISVRREARSKSRHREYEPNKVDQQDFESRTNMQPSEARSHSTTRANPHRNFRPSADRHGIVDKVVSLPSSRRHSRESTHEISDRDRYEPYRPEVSRRSTRDAGSSPYSSSVEDSARQYQREEDHGLTLQQRRSRRKSSHRMERPQIIDLADRNQSDNVSASVASSPTVHRHSGRTRSSMDPLTPLTGDSSKAMEDYFERAFRANDIRRLQGAYVHRSHGSGLSSPMTSPPRTPRSERQSKDYFGTSAIPQRPAQQSRPPSIDEGQMKDLKLHTSLLSAATTGAAIAAVSAGPSPRSSGQFTESTSSTLSISSNKQAGSRRSRRPSPVYEGSRSASRTTSYSSIDLPHVARGPPNSTSEIRPIFRCDTNIPIDGHAPLSSRPYPHRASSYSTPEQNQSYNGSLTSPSSSTTCFSSGRGAMSSHDGITPQGRIARPPMILSDVSTPQTFITRLAVCPRSQPSVGHRDWYTIRETSDIDVCPTCMSVISNTRYRDLFVPSPSRPRGQVTVCAMSDTWVRIAFLQSLRQNRPNLDYVEGVAILPGRVSECSGSKPDLRRWFDVTDPSTRAPVPNFFACSACAYKVDVVFPSMQEVFSRESDGLVEEHVCSLHTASKSFYSIIDQLERAEQRCKGRRWRLIDIEPLVHQIRRITRVHSCHKDEMMTSRMWHFMPGLPEFTVCEECYDDVVWPLSNRPIARDISKTPKPVSSRRNGGISCSVSCQLYSDRMRKLFHDAVVNNDVGLLKDKARARYEAHQRLCDINKWYELDLRAGIDRRVEIERNRDIWRRIE